MTFAIIDRMRRLLARIYVCFVLFSSTACNRYCDIHCGSSWSSVTHTLCLFAPCELGFNCGRGAHMLKLSDRDRSYVVKYHNFYRNNFAIGDFSRTYSASSMETMIYDEELEFIAQCFANTCPHARDGCRITDQMEEVGQNFYFSSLKDYPNDHDEMHFRTAIHTWFKQVTQMPGSSLGKYVSDQKYEFGAQLVWSKTNRVGCGRTKTSDKLLVVVCNYAPAGLIPGKSVFEMGKPCSKCSKCDPIFKGLCLLQGVTRTPFKRPFEMSGSATLKTSNLLVAAIALAQALYFLKFVLTDRAE